MASMSIDLSDESQSLDLEDIESLLASDSNVHDYRVYRVKESIEVETDHTLENLRRELERHGYVLDPLGSSFRYDGFGEQSPVPGTLGAD